MTRKDDTKLLIGISAFTPTAAGMRRTRLRERAEANGALTNADLELLIAILNQEKSLPNLDYHRLGSELGINYGAASMRWSRFKARLEATRKRVQVVVKKEPVEEKNIAVSVASEPVEDSTASPEIGNEVIERTQGVFGWPYNEMGWSDDED